MRIVTFASGSTGNCTLVTSGGANILIDAGISMRRIVQNLALLGLTPRDLCGVLITHEHSDHISGLPMLVKHTGVPVFAPSVLCAELGRIRPELAGKIEYISIGEPFELKNIKIRAFSTPHDARCSVGYRFEGDSIFAFATDTGCITEEMLTGLSDADAVIIEANHDPDMLRNGPYPYSLKRRILSPRGHLSNFDCGKLAFSLAKNGTRHIILGHISRENNTPEAALRTVGAALEGLSVQLYAAPMDRPLIVTVGDDEC